MYELHTSCNKSEYVTVNVDYERYSSNNVGGRRGRDHMVVGFTTTCAISAYHH